MEYKECCKHYGANPREGETVATITRFRQVELKKTLMSAEYLLAEIKKLICAGKSFRMELECGAENEGDYFANAFIYTPTEPDSTCKNQGS